MGLFDDILKKPEHPATAVSLDPLGGTTQAGQSGQGSGQQDDSTAPVIIKTSSETVFGPESEAAALKAALPPEPTVHAEEDASSVIIREGSAPIAPIAPVAPVAPVPVLDILATPVVATTPTETVLAPAEVVSMPIAPTPVPAATEPAPAVESLAPIAQAADSLALPQGPSLFDHIMGEESPVSTPAPIPTPEVQAMTDDTSSFFGITADTPTPAPQTTEALVPSSIETPIVSTESFTTPVPIATPAPESHASYASPREFIEKSLASIGLMLANIDKRHGAKMTEAEGYRLEKMRFAELEKNAYAEAEIMDRERDHAHRMEEIFQAELATDEANRTRKTEAKHEEKHVTHKKHHEEAKEEESVTAS